MRTYLALGDSFTCGTSVAHAAAFPIQLAARLRAEGVGVATPTIIAENGWPTDELQRGINDTKLQGTFDMVTLLIGVNNQYDGAAEGHTIASYRTEFASLLQTAIRLAGGRPERVVVISIPDWSAVPGAAGPNLDHASEEIDAYNAFAQQEAARCGSQYVDITPLTRTVAGDPSLVAHDGRHYSGAMYSQWVDVLMPFARRILA